MNLKERIQTVLQKLNLLDKAKANQLTQEEWGQIVNSYNQEYQSILQDDLAADQALGKPVMTLVEQCNCSASYYITCHSSFIAALTAHRNHDFHL